jgi:predicted metal-dependent enzyme (double-stranded beta helix superfamily)
MFDADRFVADCRDAAAGSGLPAVLDVVASAVSTPAEVLKGLGEPQRAGAQVLHRSPELTVFNLIWGPRMCQLPHNHGMWAVIGIYTGRVRTTSSGGGQPTFVEPESRPLGRRR